MVERGSQTAAADALEMSRAMVSRYLGEAGNLGRRAPAAPHHAQAEPDRYPGEQLLGQCREMLAMANAMQSVITARRRAGTLRINGQSLAGWCALDDFTAYPQVSVDLR